MSSFRRPLARSLAVTALIGATMVGTALFAVPGLGYAQTETAPPGSTAAANGAPTASEMKGETVEQRIATLHTALMITPDEDAKWNDVAQAMRDNAAKMDGLIAATRATAPQDKTAIADLKTYEQFAQAHVDGLKHLISSFDVLYQAMPEGQRKTADAVFRSAGRSATGAPGRQG